MTPRPGPHIALVRLSVAIVLIGLTAPRAINGAAIALTGARSVLLTERLESFDYFPATFRAARRSLAAYYHSWTMRYGPALAATALAVYLFRRRTPPWLRAALGYKP